MRYRRAYTISVVASAMCLAVLFAAPLAAAKGPSQGTITGPGIERIALKDPSSGTIGPDLANVIMQSGFFVGVWGARNPPGRLPHRPPGNLGPRYTITYAMAIPERPTSRIVQYVFPFADPAPVTHIPAGQRYWGGSETVGAWFAASTRFRQTLVRVGLPATLEAASSPSVATDQHSPTSVGGVRTLTWWFVAALLAATLAWGLARRRHTLRSSDA
jgi:hypothetical protein